MAKQVYWDDVEVGMRIPDLHKQATTQQLVRYAGASGDFYQIHYDKDFAQATGLPERIVHGALKHAFLGRMLHEWVAPGGSVKRVACQYRGMDLVNTDVVCKAVVAAKRSEDGQNLVDLEVWTETSSGEQTTPGTATVALPSRG